MKIRTDFVTNSSSSCFCVRLFLEYDSGDSIRYCGFHGEGDERYDSCASRNDKKSIKNMTCLGSCFSMIAQACEDKDLDALKKVLQEKLKIQDPEIPQEAEAIADAQMTVRACVDGDFSDQADIYQMLGALTSDKIDSIGEAVDKLRNSGFSRFTQEGLETILDSRNDRGSKEYILSLTDNNEIDVNYDRGECFEPLAKRYDNVELQSFAYDAIMLYVDQFDQMKKAIIQWADERGYDLSLNEEDDENTFFTSLGITDYVEIAEQDIILNGKDLDVSELKFPLLDFLKLLAPYVDFIEFANGMTEDMQVEIDVEDGELIISDSNSY